MTIPTSQLRRPDACRSALRATSSTGPAAARHRPAQRPAPRRSNQNAFAQALARAQSTATP